MAPCLWRSSEVDPLEPRVRAECEVRRVERAQKVVVVMSLLCAFRFAGLANAVRRGEQIDDANVVYIVALVSAVATVFPALLTQWTIDVGYVLVVLVISASVLLQDRRKMTSLEDMNVVWVPVIILSAIALRPWLNSLCLLAWTVSSTTRLALLGKVVYMTEARNYFAAVAFACCLEWSFRTSVRLELQARDSSNQLTAVQALLDSICDVMVELGAGLRLRQHSAKLADILLQGPLRSLEGVALQDFMPNERDRQTFEQKLHGCHDSGSHCAAVFHATLRDSMGSSVAMELFAVAFQGPDGQRRHLLGMREYTDAQPMQPMAIMLGGGPQAQRPPPPVELFQRGTPAAPERSDLPVRSSANSSTGSSEGDADSEASKSSARAKRSAKAEWAVRNTTTIAKRVSMKKVMESWKVEPTCCEWHAALSEAQDIARSFRSMPCSPPIASKGRGWQCQRCGINDKSWRLGKEAESCLLCHAWTEDQLVQASSCRPGCASL